MSQVQASTLESDINAPKPDHVPPELVVDFDMYNPPGVERDFHQAWVDLRERCDSDIVWTPRNGGHWIPLKGADIHTMLADYEHFKSNIVILPATRAAEQRVLPTTINPPEHGPYRALLTPPLSAKSVLAMEPVIRGLASEAIEGFRTRGSCDFISEYSIVLPIKLFMEMVELPTGDVARLKYLADQVTRPDGSMTMGEVMDAFADFLDPFLKERRENPGKDAMSTIASGKINGEQIDYEDAMELAIQLLIAGLDTVASFLGFMMLFLANNPAHRRQLIDDPDLIPAAADEFIRRFGIVQNIRTVAQDQTFQGVVMKEGDHVCIPNLLHGLDPDAYADPMEVDFTREIHDHSFFGNGPHRCPGTFLTRTEVRITLEEWLKRIPEFEVEAGEQVMMKGGIVGTIIALPLTWDVASTHAD